MSDSIKHECAVALLVLRAGGAVDGATKLSLLLEKQHYIHGGGKTLIFS